MQLCRISSPKSIPVLFWRPSSQVTVDIDWAFLGVSDQGQTRSSLSLWTHPHTSSDKKEFSPFTTLAVPQHVTTFIAIAAAANSVKSDSRPTNHHTLSLELLLSQLGVSQPDRVPSPNAFQPSSAPARTPANLHLDELYLERAGATVDPDTSPDSTPAQRRNTVKLSSGLSRSPRTTRRRRTAGE